jgi:hypothetical protein
MKKKIFGVFVRFQNFQDMIQFTLQGMITNIQILEFVTIIQSLYKKFKN